MKAKNFRITKNNIDLLESIRMYVDIVCLTKGVKVTSNDNLIISHFISEGYNSLSKGKVIEMGLVKNKQVLINALSKFRKMGLLVRKGHSEILCEELNTTLARDLNAITVILTNQ